MKKFIVLVTTLILAIYLMPNAHAEIFKEDPSEHKYATIMQKDKPFNIIKGIANLEELENSDLYEIIISLEKQIESGNIYYSTSLKYESYKYYLEAYIEYTDGKFNYALFTLEGFNFYRFHKEESGLVIDFNMEADLTTINEGFNEEGKFLYDPDVTLYLNYKIGYDETSINIELFKEYGFSTIYTMTYYLNQVYGGEVIYINVEYDNPQTLEEISSQVIVNDTVPNEDPVVHIDCNTYILDENGRIDLGEYEFRMLATDIYGNVTMQWCKVNVVDTTGPSVEVDNICVEYTEIIEDSEILSRTIVKDSSEVIDVLVDTSNYRQNYNIPGKYEIYITAKDKYDNETTISTFIEVIDKIPPIIIKKDLYTISPYELLTSEDIKNLITAYDIGCGDISLDNIEINDLDNYEKNFNINGVYRIEVKINDIYGNNEIIEIKLNVDDTLYEINTYTLILPENEKQSQDSILSLLIKAGQIDENDKVTLSSSYFNEEEVNPSGKYNLDLIFSNGTIIANTISVAEDSNISYEQPIIIEKANNTSIIIGTIIASSMVIVIIVLGVIIYKKRH